MVRNRKRLASLSMWGFTESTPEKPRSVATKASAALSAASPSTASRLTKIATPRPAAPPSPAGCRAPPVTGGSPDRAPDGGCCCRGWRVTSRRKGPASLGPQAHRAGADRARPALERGLPLLRFGHESPDNDWYRVTGPDLLGDQGEDDGGLHLDDVGACVLNGGHRGMQSEIVVKQQALHGDDAVGPRRGHQGTVGGDDAVDADLAGEERNPGAILTQPGNQVDMDEGHLAPRLHGPDEWTEMKGRRANEKDRRDL